MRRRVAVVGGGVSGLGTAHHLTRAASGPSASDEPAEVVVLEAEAVLGGKVATEPVLGRPVDTGPDALLIRSPAAAALVDELGLSGELRPPAATGAYVWTRGRLRPLPSGSVFGVPDRLWPLLRSGLLSPIGVLRAGADLVLPTLPLCEDPTIEELLRPRFGTQVFERLVEPMLGGVHAGRASQLSARSAVPEVAALAGGARSLYLALRGREPRSGRPALMTLDGGLARLVDALRTSVTSAPGGQVLADRRVRALLRGGSRPIGGTGWSGSAGRSGSAGWTLLLDGPEGAREGDEGAPGSALEVDDVVLATPAWETSRLLRPLAPSAAGALDSIRYAGVATVILGYPREALAGLPPGTGFLVPPVEGRLLVGCTWLTAKWPHRDDGPDGFVRCMVGRDGDRRWADLDDAGLVSAVRAEFAEATGVLAEPLVAKVRRMDRAMPQYTVGHADRLAVVDAALGELPGLWVTGAAYRGVGIAGCLGQAAVTASAVRARQVAASAGPPTERIGDGVPA